jgi:CheY-like chemotaxis protein
MDGCSVARMLRAEAWASDLRLIALTEHQDADLRRACEAGFDGQIGRPIDSESLRRLLL